MPDTMFNITPSGTGEHSMSYMQYEKGQTDGDYDYFLEEPVPATISKITNVLSNMEKIWDGVESGKEMLSAGDKNWQQIEWIGWFFEFWAKQNLNKYFDIHNNISSSDRSLFDAHNIFPWDFKTHVKYNAEGAPNKETPLNDKEAIDNALTKYGKIGIIIVEGEAEFGEKYESWRMEAKGKPSKTQLRNKEEGRKSRKRKDSFKIDAANLYIINQEDMKALIDKKIVTIFKQGRQADGTPRKPKYKIDASRVSPNLSVHY